MTNYITEGWKEQGIEVKEEGDHILKLIKDGQVIARFNQTKVEIDNILKEIEAGKYGN
jgi:DNA recombination-dependent growth factor C